MRSVLAPLALTFCVTVAAAAGKAEPVTGTVPRFSLEPNPIALAGEARPSRYMEASGRRAAFLGREDGSFEAWAYPLKLVHDLTLSFSIAAYSEPIPAASLATRVVVTPESATVRYVHAAFTVDATWVVPIDEPGGLVLLDVHTSEPLTVTVRFRPDLRPMWPAGLGGQYCGWEEELSAFLISEGTKRQAAIVGSPLAAEPPEQPAHNLPDEPTQFAIRVTPETAARGLIPIAIAGSVEGQAAAKGTYRTLLADAEKLYRESAAHYRRLRTELTAIVSPDQRLDLAFEWGKVALDKGFICNPQLGAGLIAGLGPSGASERPGFGWFFGGDAFINAWAISGYGDFETVRESLEFLRARQRDDGKMMHELSQGAAYIRWFEQYPYGYYHADTTPLYIVAVRDYVAASGDLALAHELWPSIRKAFEYCTLMDEDGDGLMDNTLAGLAAVETGKLRQKDVRTDVFLAAAWTDAAAATADLAALAEPDFAATARAAAVRARLALNSRFLDDDHRRVTFAVMRDGSAEKAPTVWPAFGIWRGVFDALRPAVAGTLDELSGSALATDWGARMLSRASPLYEPLSYNNGAVWPFLTGFAALALYAEGRAPAAWAYLDGTADLTFLEARGYLPELLSGDRLRSLDAAVPHQLFATTGFMSTVLRGLLGLSVVGPTGGSPLDPGAQVLLAPQLPPAWHAAHFANLRFRQAVFDLDLTRRDQALEARVTPHAGSAVPVRLELRLPPGAVVTAATGPAGPVVGPGNGRGASVVFSGAVARPEHYEVSFSGGYEVWPVNEPLRLGDRSRRLRVIDATLAKRELHVRVEGLAGSRYLLAVNAPAGIGAVTGAHEVGRDGKVHRLEITLPAGDAEWAAAEVVIRPR
jgi:glycogen debranching enzyme